jgi:cell wall-associated NlpC family hydrolase
MDTPRTIHTELPTPPNASPTAARGRRRRFRLPFAAAGAAVALAATPSLAAAAPVTTTLAQRVGAANVATHKAGSPYQWGSVGPRRFDCSGLVVFAYRAIKHPLAARTSQQFWAMGARISRAKLKKGDLVFTWSRSHGHIGIYLGKGRYVHAPGSGRRVTIAPLPAGGGFIGAVRP